MRSLPATSVAATPPAAGMDQNSPLKAPPKRPPSPLLSSRLWPFCDKAMGPASAELPAVADPMLAKLRVPPLCSRTLRPSQAKRLPLAS